MGSPLQCAISSDQRCVFGCEWTEKTKKKTAEQISHNHSDVFFINFFSNLCFYLFIFQPPLAINLSFLVTVSI